jgi:hypothetical protein
MRAMSCELATGPPDPLTLAAKTRMERRASTRPRAMRPHLISGLGVSAPWRLIPTERHAPSRRARRGPPHPLGLAVNSDGAPRAHATCATRSTPSSGLGGSFRRSSTLYRDARDEVHPESGLGGSIPTERHALTRRARRGPPHPLGLAVNSDGAPRAIATRATRSIPSSGLGGSVPTERHALLRRARRGPPHPLGLAVQFRRSATRRSRPARRGHPILGAWRFQTYARRQLASAPAKSSGGSHATASSPPSG